MNRSDRYREIFTEQFLMGPNSLRLLDEMLEKAPLPNGLRILDLGCGKGMTSLFLAKETGALVYATDLWCSATDNYKQFQEWGVDASVVPVHADANDLPFAQEYFDALVSIDSFHYFANQPGFFEEKIAPLVKPGGSILIAVPGLREEYHGSEPELLRDWVEGEECEYEFYHSSDWWSAYIGKSERYEMIQMYEMDRYKEAWEDWFATGHPLSVRDCEYFKAGVDQYLASIGMVIKRR